MPKRSVWILNHYAQTPELPGGTRHHEIGRRLVQAGHDVTLVASAFHHATRQELACPGGRHRTEMVDGVRFVWLRSRIKYRRNDACRVLNMVEYALRAWAGGRRRFGERVPAPDVVIGSTPHLLAPFAAWRIARKHRAAFIIEVRDLWPETIIRMGVLTRWSPVTRVLFSLEKLLLSRSSRVISLLPGVADYLTRIGVDSRRTALIPNGVDTDLFACGAARGNERPVRVVYAGAHGPANGLTNVLRAAEILAADRDVEISFYGDGSEKPRLVEMARVMGLTNVCFHDPMPKHEMPAVLCNADVLLLHYAQLDIGEYGISPNKLWEYMAAGRPIIFAHESIDDYVTECGCGVSIPPMSPLELAEAIRRLVHMDPSERRALGDKGRRYARERHDWTLLTHRFEKVVADAIGD